MWVRARCRNCTKPLDWWSNAWHHKFAKPTYPSCENPEPPEGKHLLELGPINWLCTLIYRIFVHP